MMRSLCFCCYFILIDIIVVNTFEIDDAYFMKKYFNYRNVKFICLLTCDKDFTWENLFTKRASEQNIAVSKINIDDSNSNDLEKCVQAKRYSIGIFINPLCDNYQNILLQASKNMWFDAVHYWLILYEINYLNVSENATTASELNDNLTESYLIDNELFATLNISVNTDITVVLKNWNSTYIMYDLYSFGTLQGGSIRINLIGEWTNFSEMENKVISYKYYQRWDFNQLKLKMVVVISPPPISGEKIDSGMSTPGLADISKISWTILDVIAERHNIRYIYTIADRWIGDYNRNITGVVSGYLYYREQDISPVIRMIPETISKMDFLHPPLVSIQVNFFYRIPTFGPGKLENQFLTPLSQDTWLCVVAMMLVCAAILLLTAWLEERPSSASYAIFSVIATLCQQFFEDLDDSLTRRSLAARKLTVLVTGVFCLLIYNYYTSSVVSWLLNGPPPSINSLQELLESPLDLIFEDIGYSRSWLQTPDYYFNKKNAEVENLMRKTKVFNKKENDPLLLSIEDGIKMVKDGGYAYNADVESASQIISRTFIQSEMCELGTLNTMERAHLYPCVQKDWPYKEFFIWSLIRLSERGIVNCIQQRMRSPLVRCEGSSPRPLALGGAAPAFLLLAAGYFLAVVILLFERFTINLKRNKTSVKL